MRVVVVIIRVNSNRHVCLIRILKTNNNIFVMIIGRVE